MRRVRVGALLAAVSISVAAGSEQPPPGELPAAAFEAPPAPPDPFAAEAALREARAELERIAGSRLLRLKPPALPQPRPLELTVEESALVSDLGARPATEWSPEERLQLRALLEGNDAALSDLAAPRWRGEPKEVSTVILPTFRVTRLLTLRDRLALEDGREALALDGLALRMDLVERLLLQPGFVAALVATPIHLGVLEDARFLILDTGVDTEALGRLDEILGRWQRFPDAGAVIAMEGLLGLDLARESAASQPGAGDAGAAALMAPVVQYYATLATACRQGSCQTGIERITARIREQDDPYRGISDLPMPNFYDALRRLEEASQLNELAHTALHLRLRAEASGRYPERLDELPAFLAAARGELPGVEYSSRGPAGASLRLVSATDESDPPPSAEMLPAVRQRHELVAALRAWELPGLLLPEDAEGVE
jgi:hypothetical protein